MRLVQLIHTDGTRRVATPIDNGQSLRLLNATSVYALALEADEQNSPSFNSPAQNKRTRLFRMIR